ncbi:NAD(P)-dependent dehydrogenase (short-subunit alcohol dehydrogenase family) [Bradyrhizobium sp. i1.3.6]
MIAYLSETDDAMEVAALVEKEGRKAVLVEGDLRSADHCRAVADRAVRELGGIDILVNNAAHQATFADIGDISDEEWRLTFDVNIHAMFFLTKTAVPHMQPGSAIINTASVNSDMPNPILLAYATTKGAIQNFTGGLAQMLAEKGIRRECGGARADMDAAHSVDNARGGGEELRQAGAAQAGRPAGGARHGLCNARGPAFELHVGHDSRRHRGQAVHLNERHQTMQLSPQRRGQAAAFRVRSRLCRNARTMISSDVSLAYCSLKFCAIFVSSISTRSPDM